MSVDTLITVALVSVWGPLLVLVAIVAIRETADWWHRRHQHGRHHPQPNGHAQRTVEEITSRLTREDTLPQRRITVILRTDPPAIPPPAQGRSV